MTENSSEQKKPAIKVLTAAERTVVHRGSSAALTEKFRSVPPEGVDVRCRGLTYRVLPTVFWPNDDSLLLADHMVINSGDRMLDVCTGSGVIAIEGATRFAGSVLALDINPAAVRSTQINADRHGAGNLVEARVSDGLSALRSDERFNVITVNPPFSDLPAADFAESATRDPGLQFHRDFFTNVGAHMEKDAHIYMTQANFGNVEDMLRLAEQHDLDTRLLGSYERDSLHTFYVFELQLRKQQS